MFPNDDDGGIVLVELSANDKPTQQPDPDVVAIAKSMELTAA